MKKLSALMTIICVFTLSCSERTKSVQQAEWPGTMEMREKIMKEKLSRIHIFPGAWRPHDPYEQIAWIKPPWLTTDYIWLDFPEAIFTDQGLLFLSHMSPRFPQLFPDEPKVPWKEIPGGISFERQLPDGVIFGGSIMIKDITTVVLKLYIHNKSQKKLSGIIMQTCVFLRHSKEFSEFTANNKFVHVPDHGWLPFPEAQKLEIQNGKYHLGWRGGPLTADLPVMVTKARPENTDAPETDHLVAITWESDTYSLTTNPQHPCMHADPFFPDLEPGQSGEIQGRLIFHEGTLDDLKQKYFR